MLILYFFLYLELNKIAFSKESIDDIFNKIKSGNVKAATCNSIEERVSVVLFGNHNNDIDYINSIVHEAEHVKQALLRAYSVDDIGENAAYTIGYIVSRMYSIFKNIKK